MHSDATYLGMEDAGHGGLVYIGDVVLRVIASGVLSTIVDAHGVDLGATVATPEIIFVHNVVA